MERKTDINIDRNCVRKIICLNKEKRQIIKKLQDIIPGENGRTDSKFPSCKLLPFEILWENKKYMCIKMNVYTTLPDYLSEHGFSLPRLCVLAACMCHAAAFLHEHHILHMDIKPDNIFLTEKDNKNPEFFLGDFDSAILLKNNKNFRFLHNIQTTPTYAAPELYMKGRASVQSDFYSLGKTLRCLLPESLPRGQPNSAINHLLSLIHSLDDSSYENRPQNLKSYIDDFLELCNQVPDSPYHVSLPDSPTGHGTTTSNATRTVRIKPLFNQKIPAAAAILFALMITTVFLVFPAGNYPTATENDMTAIKNALLVTEPSTASATEEKLKTTPAPSPVIQKNPTSPAPKNNTENKAVSRQGKKTLNLEGKNLMDITELQTLHNLKNLYLGNNQIIDISPLESFTNLKKLYLNSNLITDLLPLKSLYQLEILLLQDNNIENIRPISGLYNLKHLDISNNPALSDITALSDLTSLKFLNLIGTSVSEKQKRKLETALPGCTIIR